MSTSDSSKFSFDQIRKINDTLIQQGVTDPVLQHYLEYGLIADISMAMAIGSIPHNRQSLQSFLGLTPIPKSATIVVNYSYDLGMMIEAGKYDWHSKDIIPKRFRMIRDGIVEFEPNLVVPVKKGMSSDDAEAYIKSLDATNPWEPAKIEHLLSFGAQFPIEQRKYPIVALGSIASIDPRPDPRQVPYISRGNHDRFLNLTWRGRLWNKMDRLLAVRKKTPAP